MALGLRYESHEVDVIGEMRVLEVLLKFFKTKLFRNLTVGVVIGGSLVLLFPISVRTYAWFNVQEIRARIDAVPSETEKIEVFARWAANNWQLPSRDLNENDSIWRKMKRWPWLFRTNIHALDFLSKQGWCNELVSAARWVLEDRIRIVQHDIMFPSAGHSAISVQIKDGDWVYIDPFYGVLFKRNGQFLSYREIKENVASGVPAKELFIKLRDDVKTLRLYDTIARSFDARDFEDMDVEFILPLDNDGNLEFGKIDREWKDVSKSAIKVGLTSHFFYIGARFTTRFHFTYILPDDGYDYRIEFTMTDDIDKSALSFTNIAPRFINNNIVYFDVPKGHEPLVLKNSGVQNGNWMAIDRFKVSRL